MTQVAIDLALPSGSPIPENLTLVQGSPTFNGVGLLLEEGATTYVELNDVAADARIENYIRSEGDANAYFIQKFRFIDDANTFRIQWRFSKGDCKIYKKVNNVETVIAEKSISSLIPSNTGQSASVIVEMEGDLITVSTLLNGTETVVHSFNDSFNQNVASARFGGTGYFTVRNVKYDNIFGTFFDLPPLDYPQYITGFKRAATKFGKLFSKPSTMPSTDIEYWFRAYKTENFPNWPSAQYPVIAYSSSDHSTGDGGIYLRVYEELGHYDLKHQDSWHEWGDISSRPEFDNIQTKTTLIFKNTINGTQTETPQVMHLPDNNTMIMYFHCNGVTPPSGNFAATQATKYVTSTNPVDFLASPIIPFQYNPANEIGNGHNGYFNFGKNTIEEIPYTYIGRALHGSTRSVKASNDGKNWDTLAIMQSHTGLLSEFEEFDGNVVVESAIYEAKKEGAYYRVLASNTLPIGGTALQASVPVEMLIDSDFNLISKPELLIPLGGSGEFDSLEIGGYFECEYAGTTYGFYDSKQPDGDSGIGVVTIEDVPSTWEVITTYSNKNQLFKTSTALGSTAPNLTYSQTPNADSREDEYVDVTSVPLLLDETVTTVTGSLNINLLANDYTMVMFNRIGKNSSAPMTLEFGLTDSVDSPVEELAIHYRSSGNDNRTAPQEKARLASTIGGVKQTRVVDFYVGQGNNWRNEQEEAPTSLGDYGLLIIPASNQAIILQGNSQTTVLNIEGLDYDKNFNVFIRGQLDGAQPSNESFSFAGIEVYTYTDEAIAVPDAPTLTAAKSSDSVTLTTNSVSGATGYKYFLDSQQNDTGTFTGLEPETEYTVYARAVNALGDSAPSAIQTVTTDAAEVPNQPPTANAGPDQSVAAATQFTLDGTGSQDTDGSIVEWRWTQTAGDTVTLDLENPARPTATSPSKTTAQRLTFQLVTVDEESAVSSPSLVNIDVAAVVQNDVLNIIDKISFTFESDGMITAFPGRANRETFRLKPSDPTGLVLEDGWFDFEANDVRRVEISMLETTGVKIISTDTDSITRERSKLHVRMGDMPIKSSTKEFEPTVSVFVGNDERGVVMTAPGLSGAPKVKYYSTTARAV